MHTVSPQSYICSHLKPIIAGKQSDSRVQPELEPVCSRANAKIRKTENLTLGPTPKDNFQFLICACCRKKLARQNALMPKF